MPTLKEQQETLAETKHELAVWEVIYHILDTSYIAREGSPAEKAIRVPDCLRPVVSEETIEKVLAFISHKPIKKLNRDIQKIENMEVVILEKGDTD